MKNYKGIPEIELDLNKKPTSNIFTLVGLNESGKTSILEAIYLFRDDISQEDAHTLIPKSQQYSFDEEISVAADLELSSKDFEGIKEHLEETHQYYLEETKKTITWIGPHFWLPRLC
ncbi:MAG: AAA family ATPase [Oligoflexia bacterium]|nr:AAA family ATPase [Oligoflexia bacterium]